MRKRWSTWSRLGLKKRGFTVVPFGSGADALAALPEKDVDVVVTDLNMKGMSGLELCQHVVAARNDVPVLVLTAFGSFETAVGAIRAGAYDFVTKPVEIEALAIAIRRAAEHRALRGEVKRLREVVANARPRRADRRVARDAGRVRPIDQVSPTDATVLITGESGTGKEVVAREIHNRSNAQAGPFVAINCAAVPETLLESELFGHAKGAFTDARPSRAGTVPAGERRHAVPRRDRRDGARAAAEAAARAAGAEGAAGRRRDRGRRSTCASSRRRTATSRRWSRRRRFREDLYYRINVIHTPLPPLRARGGDVLLLAQHLLAPLRGGSTNKAVGLSPAAAERLMAYDWPGNVRELGNCLERAVALAHFEEIQVEDLPEKIRNQQPRRDRRRRAAMSPSC